MARHREFGEKKGHQNWIYNIQTEECYWCGTRFSDTQKKCPNCGRENDTFEENRFATEIRKHYEKN